MSDRVLGPLGFVDGRRITEYEFIQLTEGVAHEPTVELRDEFVLLAVDLGNVADVAVVDLAVVVVLDLHDLVADAECRAELLHAVLARRVQRGLQRLVDCARTRDAAIHRAQHLDVTQRIDAKLSRQPRLHEIDHGLGDGLGLLDLQHVEVRGFTGSGQGREHSLVDLVRAAHDARRGRLAKHLGQTDDRHRPGVNQIAQELARPDRWQLVHVADKDHRAAAGHGLEQLAGQRHIDHRALVDDQQIAVQR
jgi:hypothetical protein